MFDREGVNLTNKAATNQIKSNYTTYLKTLGHTKAKKQKTRVQKTKTIKNATKHKSTKIEWRAEAGGGLAEVFAHTHAATHQQEAGVKMTVQWD